MQAEYEKLIPRGCTAYIDEERANRVYDISKEFSGPVVYFIRNDPEQVKKLHHLNGPEIYWLTTNDLTNQLASNLARLAEIMRQYIDSGYSIIVDCPEYLLTANSPKSFLNFIQYIRTLTAQSDARMVISLDRKCFTSEEFENLTRNMRNITNFGAGAVDLEGKLTLGKANA